MTFPRVSRRGHHFANVRDVIIYPDLVVARTVFLPNIPCLLHVPDAVFIRGRHLF